MQVEKESGFYCPSYLKHPREESGRREGMQKKKVCQQSLTSLAFIIARSEIALRESVSFFFR